MSGRVGEVSVIDVVYFGLGDLREQERLRKLKEMRERICEKRV